MVFLSGLFAAGKHLAKTAYKKFTDYDNANGGHLQKMLHKNLRSGAKKLAGWAGNQFGDQVGGLASLALNRFNKWSEAQEATAGTTPLRKSKARAEPEAPAAVADQGNYNDMTRSRVRRFMRRRHR